MENGPEFSWEYSHGGQGNPNYSQMGMNQAPSGGGGRQWLHSNQANTHNFMQGSSPHGSGSHPHHASPGDPFGSYNQNMMNMYTNFKPSYGHSQVGPAMVQGVGNESSQEMGHGMGRGMGNGMADSMGMNEGMNPGMSRGMSNGLGGGMGGGSMRGGQRLAGGYSGRSNGLNDPNPSQSYRGSLF
ncbi:RNA-binding protein FUS isoform X1 [Drosophila rhopaloa]|uniref:RNA-binding protein FUS isoform X1 n=1 Tax=Drosophila rhopaloa TaxID=1041015 RepID=A0A6P4E733_DRORH|nr:RNA-binding protein FUS isoform X1 [Drosophila rhopaloa]